MNICDCADVTCSSESKAHTLNFYLISLLNDKKVFFLMIDLSLRLNSILIHRSDCSSII